MTWITENELAASKVADLFARLGENANGVLGVLARVAKDYGQTIIGLFGVSFGFYRWWLYREHTLHKRLAEYIGSRDRRLRNARSEVLETIQRPAPGQAFAAPLFIDKELRSVLRERNWDNTILALTVESSSDWQLSRAIESIKRKLETAESESVCLKQELCTAYSIRGAIAASRSGEERAQTALSHFRNPLGLAGLEGEVQLRELEAHQLQRMGHIEQAIAAYTRVIELAESISAERLRNVTKARAKRYLAEIEGEQFPKNAYLMLTTDLVGKQFSPGALLLLDTCQPLSAWEHVEKGDMHYFASWLSMCLGYPKAPRDQLKEAASAYQAALISSHTKRWRLGISTSRLRKRILEGRNRVRATMATSVYDTAWLMPSLKQPQS